uniref:Uncharacterized protein n=1 Tax=Arundo donax TaxID=35708 RepID=A0A0A9C911_ARUDO
MHLTMELIVQIEVLSLHNVTIGDS